MPSYAAPKLLCTRIPHENRHEFDDRKESLYECRWGVTLQYEAAESYVEANCHGPMTCILQEAFDPSLHDSLCCNDNDVPIGQ